MKKNPVLKILLLTIFGGLLGYVVSAVGASGLCRPAAAIGEGLRALSLGGAVGNVAAWLLLIVLSALPLLALLKRKGLSGKRDLLLPLASLEIFFLLYFLVNPTRISSRLLWMGKEEIMNHWTLSCGGVIAVTILAWILLTWLDRVEGDAGQRLPKLLVFCCVLLSFMGGFRGVQELMAEISFVKEGNTEAEITQTAGFIKGILLVIRLIPTIFSCRVFQWGSELARAVEEDPFGEASVCLAEEIAGKCKAVARFTLLCALGANLLQLLFLPRMADVRIRVELPLLSLGLCGALYLLCGYFRRAKELHDDNESII